MPKGSRFTRTIHRGDVFSVDFEPVRGSEQGKVRPAVGIQNDLGNRHSPTLIVAPLTSGTHARFDVNVAMQAPEGSLTNDSLVLLNQIRTANLSRFGRYWGRMKPRTMAKVDDAILNSLGLVKYLRS